MRRLGEHRYRAETGRSAGVHAPGANSLSGAMFAAWLGLDGVRRCPRVFIRTRRVIRPIPQLAAAHRFDFCGRFELDFRGQRQERLVFRRRNNDAGEGRPAPFRETWDACVAV